MRIPPPTSSRSLFIVAALLVAVAAGAARAETVTVEASKRYEKNRLHQFTFGGGYRELWKAPIELPFLDLEKEGGGGLTPTKRFGGNQTPVLAFKGRDGRTYTFRSTDKDPSIVLHPELQNTFIKDIVQDQMAAQHPGAPIVADRITAAAGVMTQQERLVVMPDDPALGEFREAFAGMIGTFYEYPTPASKEHSGFHGATVIIDHKELYERLAKSPAERVDALAYLRARLVDIMLGDFDRHRKQWRWAKLPGNDLWEPVPEDRDMAFVRYEGVAPRVGHVYIPILQSYSDDFDDIYGLTFHGWEQDRWLLTGLEWPAWEQVARDVQTHVTDAVIADAIAAEPRAYQELDGERLRADLTGRRDRLVEGARKFYEHLAKEVDIQATDASETVLATREGNDFVVQVTAKDAATPYFYRRFHKSETCDIRLYTRKGDDHVTVQGGRAPMAFRVIPEGQGEIDDREGGNAQVYTVSEGVTVQKGRSTKIDHRPYTPPKSTAAAYLDAEDIPPRDWGYDWYPLPLFGYEKDVGVFLGAGALFKTYGFRKNPWSTRHLITGGWAFEAEKPRASYNGWFRRNNSDLVGKVELRYSGIEVLGFYGFGNETSDSGPNKFFRVRNEETFFSLNLESPIWRKELKLEAGPWLSASDTKKGDRLIDELDPYGAGDFHAIGATTRLRYDTRTSLEGRATELELGLHENPAAGYPERGTYLELRGLMSPEAWDVKDTWGSLRGSAAGYYTFGAQDRFTIAGRGGGEAVFGTYPYQGAAYLGGGGTFSGESTIRGYRQHRFAGDEMVFGNFDVRAFLARVKLIFPGDLGVLAFSDVGRVFLDDDHSDRWHWSAGGGVWFAPLVRTNAISLTVAYSPEDVLVYLRQGFHF
jgi:hypothetical protein